MPRVAEVREPAEPTSPEQQERVTRILLAAARQGAVQGLDGVQMQEIAKESGVAIATLYRYFPSKMHLFTAVMRSRIERTADLLPPDPPADRVEAVTELLLFATRDMLNTPLLSQAMIRSNNAAIYATVAEAKRTSAAFSRLMLSRAGLEDPTPRERQLLRLVEQEWSGVLNAALNRAATTEQVEADIRLSCELLLGEWRRA